MHKYPRQEYGLFFKQTDRLKTKNVYTSTLESFFIECALEFLNEIFFEDPYDEKDKNKKKLYKHPSFHKKLKGTTLFIARYSENSGLTSGVYSKGQTLIESMLKDRKKTPIEIKQQVLIIEKDLQKSYQNENQKMFRNHISLKYRYSDFWSDITELGLRSDSVPKLDIADLVENVFSGINWKKEVDRLAKKLSLDKNDVLNALNEFIMSELQCDYYKYILKNKMQDSRLLNFNGDTQQTTNYLLDCFLTISGDCKELLVLLEDSKTENFLSLEQNLALMEKIAENQDSLSLINNSWMHKSRFEFIMDNILLIIKGYNAKELTQNDIDIINNKFCPFYRNIMDALDKEKIYDYSRFSLQIIENFKYLNVIINNTIINQSNKDQTLDYLINSSEIKRIRDIAKFSIAQKVNDELVKLTQKNANNVAPVVRLTKLYSLFTLGYLSASVESNIKFFEYNVKDNKKSDFTVNKIENNFVVSFSLDTLDMVNNPIFTQGDNYSHLITLAIDNILTVLENSSVYFKEFDILKNYKITTDKTNMHIAMSPEIKYVMEENGKIINHIKKFSQKDALTAVYLMREIMKDLLVSALVNDMNEKNKEIDDLLTEIVEPRNKDELAKVLKITQKIMIDFSEMLSFEENIFSYNKLFWSSIPLVDKLAEIKQKVLMVKLNDLEDKYDPTKESFIKRKKI